MICVLQVQVTLLDKNDSPPRFTPSSVTAQVAENVQPGHPVASLTTIDDDLEGDITYSITEGGEGKFEVHQTTGLYFMWFISPHDGYWAKEAVAIGLLDPFQDFETAS